MEISENKRNTKETLESLNEVEDKLVHALGIASEAIQYLAIRKDKPDHQVQQFNDISTRFLKTVKEVHSDLVAHSNLISSYKPYNRSIYAQKYNVSIAQEKVNIVLEHLQRISSIDNDQSMEVIAEDEDISLIH